MSVHISNLNEKSFSLNYEIPVICFKYLFILSDKNHLK